MTHEVAVLVLWVMFLTLWQLAFCVMTFVWIAAMRRRVSCLHKAVLEFSSGALLHQLEEQEAKEKGTK